MLALLRLVVYKKKQGRSRGPRESAGQVEGVDG